MTEKSGIQLSHELKSLNTKRSIILAEIDEARQAVANLNNKIVTSKGQLSKLDQEIETLTKEVIVSEHAYLQYLVRFKGLDLDELRKEMLPEKVENQIRQLRGGKFPCNDYYLQAKGGTVVTVIKK